MPVASSSPRALGLDLYGAADIGLARGLPGRAREKPLETALRNELWQAHSDLLRNMKMLVSPYPFSGRPMRFQDEASALQIFADGRFSFVVTESASPFMGSGLIMDEQRNQRRLMSFEGTCNALSAAARASLASRHGGEPGATAEGRATVKAEVEIQGCRPKLIDVEQQTFSFQFLLQPIHSPTRAIIFPPHAQNSPFAASPPWKRWCLPYVDKGSLDADAHWHPRQMEIQHKIERRRDRVSLDKRIERFKIEAEGRRRQPISVA